MSWFRSIPLALLLVVLTQPASGAPSGKAPVLERRQDIPLPGPATRFDYQSVDTVTNRLYVAHMGAGELVVFDLASGRVEGVVHGLPRVTGVCAVPALGKVYASVPGDRQVAVIDGRTLRILARVGPIGFPDGIAYAPDEGKLYVSDESGGGELVIDGTTDKALSTIPVGGEAGNTIFDPGPGHILVAIQTRQEVVEIDPRTDRITARHALSGTASPHGMALDSPERLLFVADEERATLLTVDLNSKAVVQRDHVGEGPDVLTYDPGWKRLYVASESGVVSVFTVRGRRLRHEGDVLMPRAHSVAVDPRTHLVYFPLQNLRGRPVLRVMAAKQP